MHKCILKIAKSEAEEYSSEELWIELRKQLFDSAVNICPAAAEFDQREIARLKDNPLFRRVMGDVVEVRDEANKLADPIGSPPYSVVPAAMAAPHRDDATTQTPRPKVKPSTRPKRHPDDKPTRPDPQKAPAVPKPAIERSSYLGWGDSYE
jgi:hypothetical protein